MNALLAFSDLGDWLETESGPGFLGAYLLWFFACWLLLLILRTIGFDRPLTTCMMLGLFEGLGVARYVMGSAVGMHRWDYLGLMMFFGAPFFVLRARSMRGDSKDGNGSWFSGCSSGGGCGGGGGGGGGGGCGGCGGGGD